jgi:hypothetical protein
MSNEDEPGRARWDGWLSPKAWIPLTGALGLAVIVLSVLLGLGVNGDTVTKTIAGASGRQPTHEHADFALFINGTRFNFDQPQFLSPDENGKDRSEYAHIHEPRPTVVHVHMTGTTWDEFFASLGFKLDDPSLKGIKAETTSLTVPTGQVYKTTATDTFKFFVNGVQVDGVTNTGIHDLDRVLISYGPESTADVFANQWTQVTDQACIPSERCTSRIPADEPPEQCTISNDTCTKAGG